MFQRARRIPPIPSNILNLLVPMAKRGAAPRDAFRVTTTEDPAVLQAQAEAEAEAGEAEAEAEAEAQKAKEAKLGLTLPDSADTEQQTPQEQGTQPQHLAGEESPQSPAVTTTEGIAHTPEPSL